jgi:hypothetical protein
MGYLITRGDVAAEIHDSGAAFVQAGRAFSADLTLDQLLDLAAVLNAPHVVALLAAAVERRDRDAYAVEAARWAQSEADDGAFRASRIAQQRGEI